MAIGLDKPIIVISTGMLELTDDEGLRFIIGHEVGHVLSGHAVYRTMLIALINLAAAMRGCRLVPGACGRSSSASTSGSASRRLSCDRAGLLCSQDPNAALRVHASLAGARNPNDMDVAGFLDQARSMRTRGDVRDSLLKLLQLSNKKPSAALRAAELQSGQPGGVRRDPRGELPAPIR